MCESIRPSLEEAMTVVTEDAALDYIAKRGSASTLSKV
jgi:hypothetical protein